MATWCGRVRLEKDGSVTTLEWYGPKWEDYIASLVPPPNNAISTVSPAHDLLQQGEIG